MTTQRKATRNAVGGELSEQQVEKEFTTIRDRRQRIGREATTGMIKRYYETHEVEVTKVSLMCPISKARVKVPVRSSNCRHVECIDLRSYLEFHKQLTFWECPFSFCKVQARCDSLRVDEYMSEVLRATDDRVEEVEVFADGSFEAVLRATPTMQETIDEENFYIPDSDTDSIVKAEANECEQTKASSLAEEKLREELRESHKQNETLSCQLHSERNRANKAESVASELRNENYQLQQELAAKVREIHELTARNAKLQARPNAVQPAAEVAVQLYHEPTELVSFSTDLEIPTEEAGNDATQAATDSEPPTEGESRLKQDGGSASDAFILPLAFPDASVVESGSDAEERSHAPRQRKKKQRTPLTCALCSRVFRYRSHLNSHLRSHRGEKPHECAHCGKAFANSSNLRKHERLHSGEKPYKCVQCGKAFARSGNLGAHERLHTGVKPYQCSQCDKAFTQASNLRTHERTRHRTAKPAKEAKKIGSKRSPCRRLEARNRLL